MIDGADLILVRVALDLWAEQQEKAAASLREMADDDHPYSNAIRNLDYSGKWAREIIEKVKLLETWKIGRLDP